MSGHPYLQVDTTASLDPHPPIDKRPVDRGEGETEARIEWRHGKPAFGRVPGDGKPFTLPVACTQIGIRGAEA